MRRVVVLFVVCCAAVRADGSDDFYYGKFPDDFAWSSATSAYQIEGAWNEGGKGPSIWDTFVRIPNKIHNNDNGDIACDSYHKFMEDVRLLKDLKVSHYRFSISWPRVIPTGKLADGINRIGITYYKTLIQALLDAGVKPMVTLYHWDLPQGLEDDGGWLNEATNEHFNDYARLMFQELGDMVGLWITFNEPWIVSWLGYGVGVHAPGKSDPGTNPYTVSHNLIKAHTKAWHTYNDEFRTKQKGQIGITLNGGWSEPRNASIPGDLEASERALQFDFGWFANPIFINGDYPELMKTRVYNNSMAQNLSKSRLPEFSDEEKRLNKGTSDFFGLNFYSSGLVFSENKPLMPPNYDNDKGNGGAVDPSWPGSCSNWLKVTPFGLRKILGWIKKTYNNPPVYVTENGVSDCNGTLDDEPRVFYYKHYINEMLKAIRLDDCKVKGYTAWSLMDNFEWGRGYAEKFGIHYVNFSDPSRPRTPKKSAKYLKQLFQDNGFPDPNGTPAPTPTPINASSFLKFSFSTMFIAVSLVLLRQ